MKNVVQVKSLRRKFTVFQDAAACSRRYEQKEGSLVERQWGMSKRDARLVQVTLSHKASRLIGTNAIKVHVQVLSVFQSTKPKENQYRCSRVSQTAFVVLHKIHNQSTINWQTLFYCSLLFVVTSPLLHVVVVINSGRLHLIAAQMAGRVRF